MALALALVPVLLLGVILAALEIIFVHNDEIGMHWWKHALHALPAMFLFLFVNMNVQYVVAIFNWPSSQWIVVAIRVLVGVIAFVKIQAAAAVISGGAVGEHKTHTAVIALLIVLSPYIWEYGLCLIPSIKSLAPSFNGCPAA